MFGGLVLLLLLLLLLLQTIETVSTSIMPYFKAGLHLALKEGPQLLLAKVKNAARQDWYILLRDRSEFMAWVGVEAIFIGS